MLFWYSDVNPNACHIQKLITAVIEPNYFKAEYSPAIKCDNVWISERVAVPCWEVLNCDLVKMKCVMNTVYTAVFLHYCCSQNIRGGIHGLSTNCSLTSETGLQWGQNRLCFQTEFNPSQWGSSKCSCSSDVMSSLIWWKMKFLVKLFAKEQIIHWNYQENRVLIKLY